MFNIMPGDLPTSRDAPDSPQMDLIRLLAGQIYPGSSKGGRGVANRAFDIWRQLELINRANQNNQSTNSPGGIADLLKIFTS
jgi:hypothetical protein